MTVKIFRIRKGRKSCGMAMFRFQYIREVMLLKTKTERSRNGMHVVFKKKEL